MTHQHNGSVLLVEDDARISASIGDYLEDHGWAVDYARDGKEGLARALENRYDVIVMDWTMPRMAGIEACRLLRTEGRNATPVLMLTARDTLEDKIEALSTGADDYMVKPFAIRELEARLHAMIRRSRKAVAAPVMQVQDLVLDPASLRVTRQGQEIHLSSIGMKLLTILMRESPRVVRREEIEAEIWGSDLPESDTLRSHLYNLRKAVDRPFDVPLIQTVNHNGYRLSDLSTPLTQPQQQQQAA